MKTNVRQICETGPVECVKHVIGLSTNHAMGNVILEFHI